MAAVPLAHAQGTPDCATLERPPDSASGQRCLLIGEPVIAIVYSEQDAQRLAGGRKREVLERLVGHLERWSGAPLAPARRAQLLELFGRRLQIESTLAMTPNETGSLFMLQGALAYTVEDAPLLLGLFDDAASGTLSAAPEPRPPVPPETPSGKPAPALESWRVALDLVDVTGGGAVRPQTLDFSPSRSVLDASGSLLQQAGSDFETRLGVRPETGALQAVLRLNGYYPAPPDGAFVVPDESVQVRWARPAAGGAASRQVVRLVPQRPVIAALLNLAGLDEDQLDVSSDLVGLVAARLARQGYTHFMQMSGNGRRVEVRSQAYFPSVDEDLRRAARQLLDDSIVDAGPLLPQLGGGLLQCRAAEIAPCWVVYIVRRAFANRPSNDLAKRLRDLPKEGERVLIVELLGAPGERPLYADASLYHIGLLLPEGGGGGASAALEPLAEQIADALTRTR